MEGMLRWLAGLVLGRLAGCAAPTEMPTAEARLTMAEVTSDFQLRQLLRAYRRGLISDALFEDQLREIDGDGAAGSGAAGDAVGRASAAPARIYRVRDKSFASEHEMVLHFLDQFRAGETFGGEVFALWYAVSQNPAVRGGLQVVREREAMHGRLLASRMAALGGKCDASLPEKFQSASRARLGSPAVSDADKLADFVRRLPDAEAAVAPIRAVIEQIEHDVETRALLASIAEDEMATVRWFHSAAAVLPPAP
jgi:hypothetical protein